MTKPQTSPALLITTALSEAATGLVLIATPATLLWILLGIDQPDRATTITTRIAGAALLAFGIVCWSARSSPSPQIRAIIAAALLYDLIAAAVLAHAGATGMAGLALWPAVAAHVILSVWSGWCLWRATRS